ncbi:hypothetical protein SMICM304S_02451 [Streptomyces microflavus]
MQVWSWMPSGRTRWIAVSAAAKSLARADSYTAPSRWRVRQRSGSTRRRESRQPRVAWRRAPATRTGSGRSHSSTQSASAPSARANIPLSGGVPDTGARSSRLSPSS